MDKLRAIQYFVAAAEAGSLAGAARRLEVSVPAVQKMLGLLEKSVGVKLFERTVQGVRLTASGSEYIDCCRPLLYELAAAEEVLVRSSVKLGGTLAVATNEQIAHNIILPALPLFRVRYPDIQLDFRTVHRITDADAQTAEILIVHGWPEATQDYVHRRLGMTRSLIAAAPQYWEARGLPVDPSELVKHDCLMMRNPAGILIDLWDFTRGSEKRSVRVNGWLMSNAREVVMAAVLKGQGVGRFAELTSRSQVQSGRLIPALRDWEVQGGPPTNLLYRPSSRRNPRVRLFLEFVVQLMEELEAEAEFLARHPSAERPAWHRRGYGRASAAIRNKN